MTVPTKNLTHQTSFDDALTVAFNWLNIARKKNIVNVKTPTLLEVKRYIGDLNTELLNPISSFFTYSRKDLPEKDIIRVHILKMMGAWLKSWFFLYKNNTLYCEPSVGFSIKDDGKPSYFIVVRYLDFYCVIKEKETISEDSFPVVISQNDYQWFTPKKWNMLLEEKKSFDQWAQKKHLNWHDGCVELTQIKKMEELQQYAHTLDIPFDIKDPMKLTGVMWNRLIKTWFLPHGWDIDAVKEWMEYQHKHNKKEA